MNKLLKQLLMTFFISVFSQNILAELNLNAVTIITKGIKAKYVSVYLVTGRQAIAGNFITTKVYKHLGTFESNKDIDIPAQKTPKDSWRAPSHVLIVTHLQNEFALNKFSIMGTEKFKAPVYFNAAEAIAPTEKNTKFVLRRAKLIRSLNHSGSWEP